MHICIISQVDFCNQWGVSSCVERTLHWKHPLDYAPIPLNGYYLRVTSINLSYIISKNPGSLWSVLTSGPAQKETLGKMLSGSIVVIKGFSCACEENTLNQQFMSFKTNIFNPGNPNKIQYGYVTLSRKNDLTHNHTTSAIKGILFHPGETSSRLEGYLVLKHGL